MRAARITIHGQSPSPYSLYSSMDRTGVGGGGTAFGVTLSGLAAADRTLRCHVVPTTKAAATDTNDVKTHHTPPLPPANTHNNNKTPCREENRRRRRRFLRPLLFLYDCITSSSAYVYVTGTIIYWRKTMIIFHRVFFSVLFSVQPRQPRTSL